MDAEKQAEILRQRYGKRGPSKGFGDSAVVPKRLLLPSVDDPSIWAVRCKEGKEREVVMSITKRIEERVGTKGELAITAAFERGGAQSVMKGFIYVEAQRQTDILVALDGMLNVYPRSKMTLVDIKDMPELLRVTKTPTLEPGAWVRLRRPAKHAGDLAQVLDVTENGLEARVRFIPRLDYGMRDDALASLTTDGKRKRPGGMAGPRPPQRLFSEVEARKRHPRHIQGNPTTNTWSYMGDEFENGFQVRDVKIQQLVVTDVNPSLEEVTRFASGAEDGTENLDLKALAASLKDSNTLVTYLPGDQRPGRHRHHERYRRRLERPNHRSAHQSPPETLQDRRPRQGHWWQQVPRRSWHCGEDLGRSCHPLDGPDKYRGHCLQQRPP